MMSLRKALTKVLKKDSPSSSNSSSSENSLETSKMKLTIELVPSTAWFTNVRSEVSKAKWDKIRRKSYKHADYKCEICYASTAVWFHLIRPIYYKALYTWENLSKNSCWNLCLNGTMATTTYLKILLEV